MRWIAEAVRLGTTALRGACPACAAPRSAPLCDECRDASLVGSSPWRSSVGSDPLLFTGSYHARAGGRALSPLGLTLTAFKDRRDRYAGRCLASLFAAVLDREVEASACIVAVPSDRFRVRERGLAPASWLARTLARSAQASTRDATLRRKPGHPPQRGLDGAARRQNARLAFELGPSPVAGYTVVLVDDVVTTGATLQAAATLLREAGASRVTCAVVACADEERIARCRAKTASDGKRSTAASPR